MRDFNLLIGSGKGFSILLKYTLIVSLEELGIAPATSQLLADCSTSRK